LKISRDSLVVSKGDSIKSALKKINQNQYGMILVGEASGKIIGIATDGDIRQALLRGVALEDDISLCANYDFVFADTHSSREQIIKRLDSQIKVIPILDEKGKLRSVVSKDNFPLKDEKTVYIRSRAPVRVSFGGGGSDLTHYFEGNSGAVINAAISLYSHATMKVRKDSKIIIRSYDLDETFKADNIKDAINKKSSFGLIQSLLDVVKPAYGFEMSLNSDFPVGSGLGGSAALSAVILGCFNMLRHDQWNQYELAEIAFQAERLHHGISGGWQDQYASVFGGFNFIEFNNNENIVNPIRVHPEIALELEESLILCNTGIEHHSGDIHVDQKKAMASKEVNKMVKTNVDLTYKARNYLLKGELPEFGKCLSRSWELKRNFSKLISNKYIEEIYEGAMTHGAKGGKLLGAGGGGFFLFYVPPFEKHQLMTYLKSKNIRTQSFRFEENGLKSWKKRETEDNLHKEKSDI